jgi:hypothetical protein
MTNYFHYRLEKTFGDSDFITGKKSSEKLPLASIQLLESNKSIRKKIAFD